MATVINMADEAAKLLPMNADVEILPSERECDYDGKEMTLVQLSGNGVMLRIHKCPICGFEKRYGGNL